MIFTATQLRGFGVGDQDAQREVGGKVGRDGTKAGREEKMEGGRVLEVN